MKARKTFKSYKQISITKPKLKAFVNPQTMSAHVDLSSKKTERDVDEIHQIPHTEVLHTQ